MSATTKTTATSTKTDVGSTLALNAGKEEGNEGSGSGSGTASNSNKVATLPGGDISSPHELTDWVDSVLDQLEGRFSSMSSQVESRMKEMSTRIDALESSIEDLITGASAPVQSQGQQNTSDTATSSEGHPSATVPDS